ncbi:MAG: hypothetical protein KGQ77_12320 [Betaproteobacteria bacterium]|nr:hypothetical protein [Betaproteobacteria bacterium]
MAQARHETPPLIDSEEQSAEYERIDGRLREKCLSMERLRSRAEKEVVAKARPGQSSTAHP